MTSSMVALSLVVFKLRSTGPNNCDCPRHCTRYSTTRDPPSYAGGSQLTTISRRRSVRLTLLGGSGVFAPEAVLNQVSSGSENSADREACTW